MTSFQSTKLPAGRYAANAAGVLPAEADSLRVWTVPALATLGVLLVAQFTLYAYLAAGTLALSWVMLRRPAATWPLFLLYAPLLLMVAQGVGFGLQYGATQHDILRDAYYFSVFGSALLCGLVANLAGLSFRTFIIVAAVVLGVKFGLQSLKIVGGLDAFMGASDVTRLRDELGQTSTLIGALVIPSLCLLPVWGRILFLSALLPNFLTLARTHLISTFFLFIARGLGPLRWLLLAAAIAGAGYLAMRPAQSALYNSFMDKLSGSASEAADSTFYGIEDIHAKWRAYERYIVSANIDTGDGYRKALGEGFGASVTSHIPKRQDRTATEYTSTIPVFHDSSLFVRLKLGLLGAAVWLLWWVAVLWFIVTSVRELCPDKVQRLGHISSLIVLLGFLAFFYGYPFMGGGSIETVVVGYLVGQRLFRGQAATVRIAVNPTSMFYPGPVRSPLQ